MTTKGIGAMWASMGVVLAGVFLSTGCLDLHLYFSGDGSVSAPPPPPPVATITRVDDPGTLESYLKAGIRARTGSYPVSDTSGSSPPPSFSGTNLQEAGVDEADRVKSDGQWLYVLSRPTDCCTEIVPELRILRLGSEPLPNATEQAHLALGTGIGSEGLYLFSSSGSTDLDRLAVVGNSNMAATYWYSPWGWQNGGVDVTVVDITDRTAPAAGAHLHIDGYLISSRRIGDMLYLVSRYVAVVPGYEIYPTTDEAKDKNERLLQATPLTTLLPNWQVDGVDQGDLFNANACYLLPVAQEDYSPDLVTVTAIDLHNPAAVPKSACLLGPSETVYASLEAIYLATTRYHYQQPQGDVVIASYPVDISTDLHKFALTADGPVLRGSATVPGHLGWRQDQKSFRLGEHEGVLRVVTSGGSWNGEQIRLTTLTERDDGLVELGHLPNDVRTETIGNPGEQLYAVRFVGNRGFVVTFRTIDPLYVLDLSNPADPFIAGELQIPGYSDYLHPVSETRLLGIGKDAVPTDVYGDGRWAWYQGVKLGLFDISDPASPREIDNVVIGKRGTEAGALYDHHALAWLPADPATGRPARLALPIDLHETVGYYYTAEPSYKYDWTHRGLYLFDIDPIADSAAITARGALVVDTDSGVLPWDRAAVSTDRAVIAGDAVHYLYGNQVWSAVWGNPDSLSGPQ